MRKVRFVFLCLSSSLFVSPLEAQQAQITNNGFNEWSFDGYNPIGWTTVASALPAALANTPYAAYATTLQPAFALTAREDQSDKVEGTSSVKLTTITTPSVAQSVLGATTPGVIGLGDLDIAAIDAGSPIILTGSAFAYKPDTLLLQYKYEPVGADTATFSLYFKNGGNDVAGGVITKHLFSTNGAWVTDTTIITTWTNTPDSAVFQISSGWQQGSVLHIDNLHFGYFAPFVTPTISLRVSADTIVAGETGYFIANLNQPDTTDFIVNIHGDGTASYQTDFLPSKTYFSFAAGQTVDTIIVTTTAAAAGKYVTAALTFTTNETYTLVSTTPETLFIKQASSGVSDITESYTTTALIHLYPIPAYANITVIIPAELPAQNITITDINGKIVAIEKKILDTTSINLANYVNGNYLITFTDAFTNAFTAAHKIQVIK